MRYGPLVAWLFFISFASTGEFSSENTSRIIRPILLFLFPNLSEGSLASVHFLTRKAAHFCEYAILGLLAWRAFASSSKAVIRQHWFALALALVVVNSLIDELHQTFVASRTGSIFDSAIDVCGGLTILIICKVRENSRGRDA